MTSGSSLSHISVRETDFDRLVRDRARYADNAPPWVRLDLELLFEDPTFVGASPTARLLYLNLLGMAVSTHPRNAVPVDGGYLYRRTNIRKPQKYLAELERIGLVRITPPGVSLPANNSLSSVRNRSALKPPSDPGWPGDQISESNAGAHEAATNGRVAGADSARREGNETQSKERQRKESTQRSASNWTQLGEVFHR